MGMHAAEFVYSMTNSYDSKDAGTSLMNSFQQVFKDLSLFPHVGKQYY